MLFFSDDGAPYSRDESIFASDGNFAFDRVLLAIEAAMIIMPALPAVGLNLLLRRRRPGV